MTASWPLPMLDLSSLTEEVASKFWSRSRDGMLIDDSCCNSTALTVSFEDSSPVRESAWMMVVIAMLKFQMKPLIAFVIVADPF